MTTRSYFIFTAVVLLIVPLSLRAQTAQPSSTSKAEQLNRQVLGSVSETRIRFTCLGDLIQLRLEVFDPAGEVLFDSGFKPGNVVDWPASDAKGQPPGDGTYLCVVSVKDATGAILRKQAIATVRDQSASLREADKSLLSSAQSASVITGEDVNVTIVEAGAAPTAILAHDGVTAHLVSGPGGLSISSGDFFANKLLEHIRITAEGNVGIGVANPQARLDVAGRIKATEGIVFPDGSVQVSAARKTLGAASLKGGDSQGGVAQAEALSPDTSGTGTTGKIPKWLDGPNGVLNDSNITEVTGAIGMNGTPDTRFRLDVNGSTRIRGSNPGFNLEGLRSAGNIWLFQTVDDDGRFRLFGQDNVNPGVERLTIALSTGNVGIGATVPTQKLHVAGNGLFTGDVTVNGTLSASTINGTVSTATNALNLGGVAANQFVQTTDSRLSDARNPLPNSANYIQNTTSVQSASNFNISGNGTADIFNAVTQYNIVSPAGAGSIRIMGISGSGDSNTYVGRNTAFQNPTGSFNSLFGNGAGREMTGGGNNSFFGSGAGNNDQTGNDNAFFGRNAGFGSTANDNSFFGSFAGGSNVVGNSNSFFGKDAGRNNSSGSANSFFGFSAGAANTTEANNSFFGASSNGVAGITNATAIGYRAFVAQSNSLVLGSINGANNATADTNVGIGTTAPSQRLHVVGNGLFTGNLTVNGTLNAALPVGSGNYIQNTTSQQATSNFNISGNGVIGGRFGVGTNSPGYKLEVIDPLNAGLRVQTNGTGGAVASFGGNGAFFVDGPGTVGGRFAVLDNGNAGIGTPAPNEKLEVSGTGVVRARVNSDSNAGLSLALNDQSKWAVATTTGGDFRIFNDAIGQNAVLITTDSNDVFIGGELLINSTFKGLRVHTSDSGNTVASFGGRGDFLIDDSSGNSGGHLRITDNGLVLINRADPTEPLTDLEAKLFVNGGIRGVLQGFGISPICYSPAQDFAPCVSSIRFKENVNNFSMGLNLIRRLRPVSFNWKQGGMADMGLIAEEVAKEEPLLATYDSKGEIQGVKYDRVGVVLINAVTEQQQQIEAQRKQIEEQQKLIEALRILVCEGNPQARLCK